MVTDITPVLKRLQIKATGQYDNDFYIIKLADSDEYAKMYTQLGELAINTEEPNFGKNTNDTTVRITNYFEIDVDGITFDLFLIANFENDEYKLKIRDRN